MKIAGRLVGWSLRDEGLKGQENELPGPIDTFRRVLYRVLDFGDLGWVDLSYAFRHTPNLVDVFWDGNGLVYPHRTGFSAHSQITVLSDAAQSMSQ